ERRLKQALYAARGRVTPRSEIVVLDGWTSSRERRAFTEALASAVEGVLGRAVSIVTVAPPGRASAVTVRRDRPDAVVAGTPGDGGVLRERLAAELAARSSQAPIVLVELDEELADTDCQLTNLADTILHRIYARPPAYHDNGSRRVAFVQDGPNGS